MSQAEDAAKKAKVLKDRKEAAKIDDDTAQSNKLLVKNLAFEATAQDVRGLFKEFGALQKVRLPKKVNS